MPSQTFAEGALDAAQQTGKLSYDGYKKVWSDEFNGDSLNRADWNVEIHEKGWVNNELQEYVSALTLSMGIERILKEHVPGVTRVEQVNASGETDDLYDEYAPF